MVNSEKSDVLYLARTHSNILSGNLPEMGFEDSLIHNKRHRGEVKRGEGVFYPIGTLKGSRGGNEAGGSL